MRLLLVTEFFPQDNQLKFTGGVEVRTYYLYKELSKHHQIKVINRSPQKISASFISLFDRIIFVIKAVVEGLRSRAELVEASNFVTYVPVFIIGTIKRIPKIAWYPDVFIGTWTEKFGPIGWVGEIVERLTLKLPWNHIIALSHQTKQKLIAAGVPESKITVVYPGVDQAEFRIQVPKAKHPTICCISRDIPYKRITDLKTAFTIIKKTLPDANLIITSGQIPRIDLIKKLKSSHVFCLPSIVEGFGLVTLEALAAGLPYVNADIPINREVTQGGQGGLLFTPQDPTDIAQKTLQLLTDKKLYQQKIAEGQHLLKNYSWSKSALQTEAVYKSVINKKHKRMPKN